MHQATLAKGVQPGLPVGSARLWDVGGRWNEVSPARGTWNFTALDTAVNTANRYGASPLVVLGATPAWASSKATSQDVYGLGAAAMPRSVTYWREYVTEVAQRYKGRVRAYQIWNEPNLSTFWTGTVAQMVQLTREARTIIKRVDPTATVVSPGFSLRNPSDQAYFRTFLQAGGARYSDVIGLHPYPAPTAGPEGSLALINTAKAAMATSRVSKPIWNTEINYGAQLNNAGAPRTYNDANAASYVARTLLLNAANGVSRVYWYAWDTKGYMGIDLSRNGQPTRAAESYRIVEQWMLNNQLQGCTTDRARTYTCVLRFRDGSYGKVMWNPSRTIRVRTTASTTGIQFINGRTLTFKGARNQTVIASPVLIRSTRL
nr:glycosyl hydrolase [Motilibacter aurantiacus]